MEKLIWFLIFNHQKKLNTKLLFMLTCFMMIVSFTRVSALGLNRETSKHNFAFEVSKDEGTATGTIIDEKGMVSLIQVQKVTGTITDAATGEPIIGANVVIESTTIGAISDASGKFSIDAPKSGAVIVISFLGYVTEKISFIGQSDLDVKLVPDTKKLEEVVVTGYGTQKKVDLTGAVGNVKANKLEVIPATNLSETMAGRMSGVFVDQSNGVPGISSSLIIRSASSWNDSPPLYIIDGVVLDKSYFDRLSSYDIEDISVLKDAASASIYGSRATGGVVLVTTKKGAKGKPVITYNASYSFQKPTSTIQMMSAEEGPKFINDNADNNGPGHDYLKWDAAEVAHLKQTGLYHWLDYVNQTPATVKHSLNVSGGNDIVRYFIGGDYLDNKGFITNLGYNKYSLRGNIEANITKNLTATLNITSGYDQKSQPNNPYIYNGQSDDLTYLYGWLYVWPQSYPPYINGKAVNSQWNGNFVDRVKNGGYDRLSNKNTDVLMSLNYKIPGVTGLSVKASYSLNNDLNARKIYNKKTTVYDFLRHGSGGRIVTDTIIGSGPSPDPARENLHYESNQYSSYQLNGQINYNRDFGKHHVDAFVVYEQYESSYSGISLTQNDFPVVRTDQFFATSPDPLNHSTTGSEYETARISYVGKANYSYANKYYISASVRRDGSMLFAPDKRWGVFPAVSAGWRISDETFFKDNITFIQSLKFRGSYGLTGNDNVGGWLWQEQYSIGSPNYFGNALQSSIYFNNIPIKDLTWEKSKSYNYGIDVILLKNLSITADYWTRNTYDILGPRIKALPSSFGAELPAENYGKVDSHGFELEIGYEGKTNVGLNYHIRGNFSYATNKVIKRDYASNGLPAYNPNGKPTNFIVGLESTGIIRTQPDLDKLPAGFTVYGVAPQLGSLSFKDNSGPEGKPDGKIDDYDKAVISTKGNIPYTGGLSLGGSWKGLSLEVFFQGSFGQQKLYTDLNYPTRQADLYDIPFKYFLDSWTPQNPNAKYPRAYEPYNDLSFMNYDSDFWLFKASYVRLRQLTVDYLIPQKITKKAGIGELRLNLTSTNLITWSGWKLYDPQLRANASYPIMKTFTFGITITL